MVRIVLLVLVTAIPAFSSPGRAGLPNARDLDVRLSDNAFDIAPGKAVTMTAASDASVQVLRDSLSVRTLFGAATKVVSR